MAYSCRKAGILEAFVDNLKEFALKQVDRDSPRYTNNPDFKMKHLAALALTIASIIFFTLTEVYAQSSSTSRPNIILIVADDLGYGDVGAYGQTRIKTPNIDSLAREGIKFSQFYAGSPVCAPSRCSLLTGKHGGHAYIRDNIEVKPEGQEPVPAAELMFPELLKKAGYATGAFGKWGLGFVGTEGDPNRHGFDLFYGYNCQREAHNYYPDHLWKNSSRIVLEGNTRGLTGRYYSHDLIEAEALNFIRTNSKGPFFAFLAFTIPHLALQVPEDSLAEYLGKWDDPPYDGKNGYLPHPHPRAAYAAMITRMDRSIGRVMELLREKGIDRNTLVIFTSDNGAAFGDVTAKDFEFRPGRLGGTDYQFFKSAGPFKAFKGSIYEGGLRVPFIARWPGRIKANTNSELPAVFYDLMPTICAAAGVKDLPAIDGVSLIPSLTGRGVQKKHEFLYWDFNGYGGQQAVRMGDWKALRRNLGQGRMTIELYNLRTDVGERQNVASQHPEIVERARKIMREQHLPSAKFPLKALDEEVLQAR